MIPNKVATQEEGQLLYNRINSVAIRHLGVKVGFTFYLKDEQSNKLYAAEPL